MSQCLINPGTSQIKFDFLDGNILLKSSPINVRRYSGAVIRKKDNPKFCIRIAEFVERYRTFFSEKRFDRRQRYALTFFVKKASASFASVLAP